MSFGVTFAFDVYPSIAMLDAVEGELDGWHPDELAELASLAMFRIKRRTRRGEDMFGDAFAYYSEEWRETREETGRQTDHVDLMYTGAMLAAMTPRAGAGAAIVGWTSQHEADKAMGHHYGIGHLPERPWFDIAEGSDDLHALMSEAVFQMHRRIESLGHFS